MTAIILIMTICHQQAGKTATFSEAISQDWCFCVFLSRRRYHRLPSRHLTVSKEALSSIPRPRSLNNGCLKLLSHVRLVRYKLN